MKCLYVLLSLFSRFVSVVLWLWVFVVSFRIVMVVDMLFLLWIVLGLIR